ncbi:MAG: hypothetical protein DRJ01_08515 [Bacteroidetes bacterium]|nr:MAG: hypothetical protein DRJ01_08515 [Bacteroidota bacterium]
MKNRNNHTKFSWLFLLLLVVVSYNCTSQNKTMNTTTIKYVGLNIMTPINVSCENFEKAFGKQVIIMNITNQKDIDYLLNSIKKLSLDNNIKSADIRIKIEIIHDKTIDIICLGRFHIVHNGSFYKMNPELMMFLKRKIEKNKDIYSH